VLIDITQVYALSEHSVLEFELHALMGWKFDSTNIPIINVYRLDLHNDWFYFPECS